MVQTDTYNVSHKNGANLVLSANGISIGSVSHFCTARGRVCRESWASPKSPPPSKLPLRMGNLEPINTWFLQPTRVNIPNVITTGSTVSAEFTVETDRLTN